MFPSFLKRTMNQTKYRSLRKTQPIASFSGNTSSDSKRVNKWKRPAKLKLRRIKENINVADNLQN